MTLDQIQSEPVMAGLRIQGLEIELATVKAQLKEAVERLNGLIVAYDTKDALINDRTDLERNAERVVAARSFLAKVTK
jgi:hypothetical protein